MQAWEGVASTHSDGSACIGDLVPRVSKRSCASAPCVGEDVRASVSSPGERYPLVLGKPAAESSQGASPHPPKPERIERAWRDLDPPQPGGTWAHAADLKETGTLALHTLGLGPQGYAHALDRRAKPTTGAGIPP